MNHYVKNNFSALIIKVILLIFLCSNILAQEGDFKKNEIQNIGFSASILFKSDQSGESFGSRGVVLSGGVNLAKFFSKKYVLGLYFDIKPFSYYNSLVEPSNKFSSDFNSMVSTIFKSAIDSNNTSVINQAMMSNRTTSGYAFDRSSIVNYGIMFSPFPNRYGGVMLQIKSGHRKVGLTGVYGNKFIKNKTEDKSEFVYKKTWIYELTIKPLSFFRNTYIYNDKYDNAGKIINSFIISFYYERLNIKNAEFNGTKFTKMVSEQFISKYGIDHRFGFKIGFGLY